ncbi:hypothetical protein PR048_017499 [Dryococelus australis]|uniref:HAT C-terminal dimerisation domain-containing protein n=1 Tax=Dryococelus australis TaxID=614101 RepID=A0ABQ9H9N5_9NEOP|nr:hypothetical protein PR048_017499 [Dryococelus australis]
MLLDPLFKSVILPKHEKIVVQGKLQSEVEECIRTTLQPVPSEEGKVLFQYSNEPVPSCSLWEAFHDVVQKTKRSILDTYLGKTAIVLKYLPISATSPACECVFSQAGNIITSKRTLLTEEHEELVFLPEDL